MRVYYPDHHQRRLLLMSSTLFTRYVQWHPIIYLISVALLLWKLGVWLPDGRGMAYLFGFMTCFSVQTLRIGVR